MAEQQCRPCIREPADGALQRHAGLDHEPVRQQRDAFLQKPFTLDSLTGKVREVLDSTTEPTCRV